MRFFVGKLVELAYVDAALASPSNTGDWSALDGTKVGLDRHGMDVLRASLGHPLNMMGPTIRCIVSGVHGLDAGSSTERFIVASRLWMEGISAEYLAQSGVMASLLKHQRGELQGAGTSVSWQPA